MAWFFRALVAFAENVGLVPSIHARDLNHFRASCPTFSSLQAPGMQATQVHTVRQNTYIKLEKKPNLKQTDLREDEIILSSLRTPL